MANSEYRVLVGIDADLAGGKQAEDTLKGIKNSAGDAAPEVGQVADQLEHLGGAAKTAKDGLEIANGNFRGLPGLLRDASQQGDSLVASLAKVGLVGGAFAGGFKLMEAAVGSWMEVLAAAQQAEEEYWNSVMEKSRQAAAVQVAALKQIEEARGRVIAAIEHENELNKINREQAEAFEKSVSALRDARERAGDVRARAGASSDAERAGIDLAAKSRDQQQEVSARLTEAERKLAEVQEQLAAVEEERKTKAQKLSMLYDQLVTAQAALDVAAEGAPQSAALRRRNEAQAVYDKEGAAARQGEELARAMKDKLDGQIANLQRDIETIKTEGGTARFELEQESKAVLRDLADQLRAAQQRAVSAGAGVADASNRGTGLAGALAEQGAANAEVARLTALIQALSGNFTEQAAALATAQAESAAAQVNAINGAGAQIVTAHARYAGDVVNVLAAQHGTLENMASKISEIAAQVKAVDVKAGNVQGQIRFKTP